MRIVTGAAALGLLLLAFLAGAPVAPGAPQQLERAPKVLWLEVSGFIGPATAEHVEAAVAHVGRGGYSAILLTLDTFGGAVDSTFRITDAMQASPVPTMAFVFPAGKQALSAGTFILMAADLAGMAPFTIIGSAQPVVGGSPTNETKIVNFLVERMSGFARLHGRNVTQATRFITHNDNLSPEAALSRGVIEVMASTLEEFLQRAHGRTVNTLQGPRTLDTGGATLEKFDPSIRTGILRILSEPVISSLLLSIGILSVILGLTSPGWGAEIVGLILILLGLIGQGFNVNLGALALTAIGAILLVYEVYSPGFGIIGIGGIITLGIGMSLLVTQPPGELLVSTEFLASFLRAMAISLAGVGGFFAFVIYKAAGAQRAKRVFEPIPLNATGRAVDDLEPERIGYVVVRGEYWRAKSGVAIKARQKVRVVGKEDGVLLVEPSSEKPG
jgi:membrane-bound serine protease (ClpP class)